MKQAGRINSKRRTRARSALGLFAAVWLNLALAPCAMAAQPADDHDYASAAMQGHHDMHAGMTASMPCADDALADCSLDEDFSHDVRQAKSKLKDAHYELPMLAIVNEPALSHEIPHDQRAPPWLTDVDPGAPPALHLLNCVFLD